MLSGMPIIGSGAVKMTDINDIDLSEFEALWARRAKGVEQVKLRTDIRGATRPARDPEEAAFLKETGQEGPFIEVERPGWKEWLAYKSLPPDQQQPPGLTAADFARPFLEAERARQAAEKSDDD
jgi:hypothetical protein